MTDITSLPKQTHREVGRRCIAAGEVRLNLVLTALVLVALRPGVTEAAEQGRRFMAGAAALLAVGDLIYPPIVSPSALLIALVLAAFKPWARSASA